MKEILQEVCIQPEMVRPLKNQAADFICNKYNWDDVVQETLELYRSEINGKKGKHCVNHKDVTDRRTRVYEQ